MRDLDDPVGYILGITERIWEGREIGNIRRWYADDILVRSPAGLVRGNEPVVGSSLATLAECPDRRLPGEDVIWTGDSEGGFLSSHRLACWMTHARDGAYGPARGREVRYRIIADCHVREGEVREEWLVRDQGAIARCLGLSPRAMALRHRAQGNDGFLTRGGDVAGPYRPTIEPDGPAGVVADVWRRIWDEHDLSVVRTHYDAAATLEGPGGETHAGHGAIDAFHLGYLAAFPRAALTVEHLFANHDAARPTRVAMRWSLDGRHEGHGRFGVPTGRAVHVMGLTHAEVAGGRVRAEWTVTDEVAIWKQLLA